MSFDSVIPLLKIYIKGKKNRHMHKDELSITLITVLVKSSREVEIALVRKLSWLEHHPDMPKLLI